VWYPTGKMHPSPLPIFISLLLLSCTAIQPTSSTDRVATNGLTPALILDYRDAAISAATVPLSQTWSADLLSTTGGRELLRYLVMCALPSGEALTVQIGTTTRIFIGDVGLAPSWISQPLDADQQRWISACLLARSNALGISVLISILGPDPQLASSSQESQDFPVEEGAFYGDIFSAHPEMFACRGSGSADAGGMLYRHCTVAEPAQSGRTLCGFSFVGSCAEACSDNGEVYSGCHGLNGEVFEQVITTHVTL
jgi:hypothetical protein